MKSNVYLSFIVILSIFFFSCEKEDSINCNKIESKRFYFEYKDKSYVLNYYFKQDSSIVYEDVNIYSLYKEIIELPELCTFIKNDSTVAFYDTDKDLLKHLEKTTPNHTNLKSDWVWGATGVGVNFYKDKDFKGEILEIRTAFDTQYLTMPNGWDNQVSSVEFYDICCSGGIFLYSNPNCVGKNVYWSLKKIPNPSKYGPLYSSVKIKDLSAIYTGDGVLGFGRPTFNDDLSSFKIVVFREPFE